MNHMQANNWNTYPQLLQSILPSVLNQFMYAGQIDQNTAQRIQSDIGNWGNDFLSKIQHQGQIDQHQFHQYLSQYISNLIQMMRQQSSFNPNMGMQQPTHGGFGQQPRNPYGSPQPQQSWGQPQQRPSWGQPQGNSFGGAASFGHQPNNQPSSGSNPFAPAGGNQQPTNDLPPMEEKPFIEPSKPYIMPELIDEADTPTGNENKVVYTSKTYKSNEDRKMMMDVVEAHTRKSFVNDDDIVDFVEQNVNTAHDNYLVQLSYSDILGVTIPKRDVTNALIDIRTKLQEIPPEHMRSKILIEKFDQAINMLPRRISDIFERLVITRMNKFLKSKVLHNSGVSFRSGFSIHNLKGMKDLTIYGDQPKSISFVTETPEYDNKVEHYIHKAIMGLFGNMELADSNDVVGIQHYENALGNTVLGDDPEANTVKDDLIISDDKQKTISVIDKHACVIIMPTTVYISNIPVKEGSVIDVVGDGFALYQGNNVDDLSSLLKDTFTATSPVDTFLHVKGKVEHYRIGRLSDDLTIISKV